MIDFPNSPTSGQVFDRWTWTGTAWVLTPATGPGPWVNLIMQPYTEAHADGAKCRLNGDVIDIRFRIRGTGTGNMPLATLPPGYNTKSTYHRFPLTVSPGTGGTMYVGYVQGSNSQIGASGLTVAVNAQYWGVTTVFCGMREAPLAAMLPTLPEGP